MAEVGLTSCNIDDMFCPHCGEPLKWHTILDKVIEPLQWHLVWTSGLRPSHGFSKRERAARRLPPLATSAAEIPGQASSH